MNRLDDTAAIVQVEITCAPERNKVELWQLPVGPKKRALPAAVRGLPHRKQRRRTNPSRPLSMVRELSSRGRSCRHLSNQTIFLASAAPWQT